MGDVSTSEHIDAKFEQSLFRRVMGKLTGSRMMMSMLTLVILTVLVLNGHVQGTDFVDGLKWVMMIFIGSKSIDHTNV